MPQIVPLHTTNISLPDTCILSKSNDPIFFKVIIITISIRFSIKITFYLILDEVGYYSNCNTSQLIVFLIFFNPLLDWFFLYSFIYSFFFCLPSSDVFFSVLFSIFVYFLFAFFFCCLSFQTLPCIGHEPFFVASLCFLYKIIEFFIGTFLVFYFTVTLLINLSLWHIIWYPFNK